MYHTSFQTDRKGRGDVMKRDRSSSVSGRLSTLRLGAYGGLGMPVYMLMMPTIVYLPPFYAGELGLGLSAIGAIFFLARILDGISDLVVGALSDRTRHRSGPRKIWIACGIPLLMIATYFLCRPVAGAGSMYLTIWLILLYVAWTMVQVPYLSWGAEMSSDYNERSRVTAFREGGGMIGVLLAVGLPYLIFGEGEPPFRDVLGVFVISILVLLPLTGSLALVFAPQGERSEASNPSFKKIWQTVSSNKPFLRLMIIMSFMRTGACVFDAAEFWLLSYWCKQPSIFFMLLFIQYICSIAAIPLVVRVSRYIGKHGALIAAACTNLTFFAILTFAPTGLRWPIIVAFIINAIGNAALWVIPASMVADTVDYGELKGVRGQSGTYMAIFTLLFKISLALGVVIALPLLDLLNFSPTNGANPAGLNGLVWVACGLPALMLLPAIFLLRRYPLTEQKHDRIRRILNRSRERDIQQESNGARLYQAGVLRKPADA
jgi:glycoside/pentoside/hexuronide:cation symporter, GPH family